MIMLYLIPGWYEGYLKFGEDFKVCMNKFVNPDYSRFRDWVIWIKMTILWMILFFQTEDLRLVQTENV